MRPNAPSTWAAVTSTPADSGDQPRSIINHTRVNVHTTHCGTTSSTDTAWMRHSTSRAAVRVGQVARRAPRRAAVAAGRAPRPRTPPPPRRTPAAGNSSATPTPCVCGEPRDHQRAERRRPTAARSAGCPSPDRAVAAGTSRPPVGRWPNCCWPPPFRRAAGTRPQRPASAPRPPRTPPPRSAPSRRVSTKRSPTRSTTYPQAIRVSTMPKLGIADTSPARARSRPIVGVQGGDQEGHTVDEDVGAQRRGQRDDEHRPAPRGADRVGGHPTIVPRSSHDAE